MPRKILVLLAPIAVVVGLALMPVSASAVLKCPKGQSNPAYCEEVCLVPQLHGRKIWIAYYMLLFSDCTLGKVTTTTKKGGVKKFEVLYSNPPAGKVLPPRTPIDVVIRIPKSWG